MRTQNRATESIIRARLLVLQSKRIMLSSLQRRLEEDGYEVLKERIERLRSETDLAQHRYRTSILAWGAAESMDYWLIAYGRLIEVGNVVVNRLRAASDDLPAQERYQVAADVEMLEHMLAKWSATMRAAMSKAVA